ncbi:RRP5 -like protein, partial [Asbolus verrucosus]
KVQSGMIVLSCIRHISNLALQIEFPGLTFGLVTINRISDSFTDMLKTKLQENIEESCNALKSIFKVGQLLPAKIMTVENTDKGRQIQASVNPRDINADKTHNSFKKGTLIWANLISELDHGYELSVGVKNCRVFLPFKNTDAFKKYTVGELLYCVVHKAENSNIATTLTVSAKREHVDKIQVKDDLSSHDLPPGTKIEVQIEVILRHGIKGRFLGNHWCYLDETQMFSKINLAKVTEGSTISAYVLFVEPVTKITYLTLHGLDSLPAPQHELGKIMSAEVVLNASRGIYLKLNEGASGFVANKRLLSALPKDAELDIVDAVRKKYPIGSRHSCRILDYNYMQQLYICTFERKLIKETIFSVKDLKLGQNVAVRVEEVVPNGLIVKAGHVQGFVPNLHLSDVKYNNSIKGKYSVGMTVNARVLNITEEHNVIFTLKQGLVEAETCLSNIENASMNSQYVGFVVQTKISGALVAFYGDVKGWISNKLLNSGNTERYTDPRDYFFIGQVVPVWVLGFRNDKLWLSLSCSQDIKRKKVKIGQNLSGTVTAVHSGGIDVEVGQHKIEATIPAAHLGDDPSLCPLLLTKVSNVNSSTKDIILNIENSSENIEDAQQLLMHNIEDLDRIIQFSQQNNWKLTQKKIGERVECRVEKIDADGSCVVTLPEEVSGLVASHLCCPNVEVGAVIEGVVIDYNFIEGYVHICLKNDVKQRINKIQGGLIRKPLQSSCVAEILISTQFYVLGVLKDSMCNRQLVYLPQFFIKNNTIKPLYDKGAKLKIVLHRKTPNRIIGIPKKLVHALKQTKATKTNQKRQKIEPLEKDLTGDYEDMDTVENEEEKTEMDEKLLGKNEDEHVIEDDATRQDISKKNRPKDKMKLGELCYRVLTHFMCQKMQDRKQNEKKKKMTSKERADLAKREEERITKIEKELADSTATPQTAEQFDRLLLANPNSSELWLKYMAMHIATTELEKAKAVGKRAIETINVTLVKEKFNVWIALINLEVMYGTKESFNKLFEDAVKYNDSLEIYLSVIKLLASSGRLSEMEEKIKKVRSKEKQNSRMWLEIGQIYYSLGKFKEARNIKEAALKSILDKRTQFDLILRFGVMEFQSGDLEQAIANFETILDTYPSKINIWFIYVDQLVKRKKIERARNVLERAVQQRFPMKAMKAIFQKFVSFEEQHGTSETVLEVKKKAKEY